MMRPASVFVFLFAVLGAVCARPLHLSATDDGNSTLPSAINGINAHANVEVFTSIETNPSASTVSHIRRAHSYVLGCVYKLSDEKIYEELLNAMKRGVRVSLVVDYHENHKHHSLARQLAKQGADVRFFDTSLGYEKLHAKFTVYDGNMATAGSNNWSHSSRAKNVEIIIELTGSVVARFESKFRQLQEMAVPV